MPATGNNGLSTTFELSIRVAPDGQSFSLPETVVSHSARSVVVSVDSPRQVVVPAEECGLGEGEASVRCGVVAPESRLGRLLADHAVVVGGEERIAFEAVDNGCVVCAVLPKGAVDALAPYGRELVFAPLLADAVRKALSLSVSARNRGGCSFVVGQGRRLFVAIACEGHLMYADTVEGGDQNNLLYILAQLQNDFGLSQMTIDVSGTDAGVVAASVRSMFG